MEEYKYQITEEDQQYKRLDKLLSDRCEQFSRSYLKHLFNNQLITLGPDGSFLPDLKKIPPEGTVIIIKDQMQKPEVFEAQEIELDIVFEDEHLIVVNKKAGMVVHPAAGNWEGTLVNAVLFHCPDIKGIGDAKRPGIVHRLDKGTSGVMVVAKTHQAHEKLVEMFSTHSLSRKYMAICYGEPGFVKKTIESFIRRHPLNRKKMQSHAQDGKRAVTHLFVKEKFKKAALIECTLETGRTHQIRVHLSQDCHLPLLNDHTYSRLNEKKVLSTAALNILQQDNYPMLHAAHLSFQHPITQKKLEFNAALPQKFNDLLEELRNE